MDDLQEREASRQKIGRTVEIEEVLLKCINTLRSGEDVDRSINELLEIIANFHDADRAYIFEFTEDMLLMNNTYEWCREGVEPEIDMLTDMEISLIDRWLVLFKEFGEVYINSRDGELSKDSEEYRILAMQDIHSLMAAPLYLDGRLAGFMGVDNPGANTDTLLLLRSVAALVVNDIQKRVTLDQKVIGAIAKIYISMHLLNLSTGIHREYQSSRSVRQLIRDTENSAEQLRRVMEGTTDKAYLPETLAFVDLSTLDERMKNVSSISHEFYSSGDRWCRASFIVVNRTEDGKIENVIYAVQLIDEEKRRELEYQRALKQAIDNQDEMYGEMLKMLGTGVVAYDVDTKEICLINETAREMFGFTEPAETVSNFVKLQDRLVSDNKEDFIEKFKKAIGTKGYYTCEYALNNGKRLVYIFSHTKMMVLGNGRRITLSSLIDVTEKRVMEEQLRKLSRTDVLTQICNRRYGEQQIENLLTRNVSGMFCLFDVDKFKSINDTYGHTTGDKALIAIADCLKNSFEKEDVLMRLGGDEFAVYAVGVENEEEGKARIERFFRELEQVSIPEMKGSSISVSLGAVFCNRSNRRGFDEMYQMADSTMYIHKSSPGNQYGFYNQDAKRG